MYVCHFNKIYTKLLFEKGIRITNDSFEHETILGFILVTKFLKYMLRIHT